MLTLDIGLISSRPYHPQTNGKLERSHRSVKDEAWCYNCPEDYVGYYNTCRLHWVLDIDNYKTATDKIKRQDPKWMETDINGGYT